MNQPSPVNFIPGLLTKSAERCSHGPREVWYNLFSAEYYRRSDERFGNVSQFSTKFLRFPARMRTTMRNTVRAKED